MPPFRRQGSSRASSDRASALYQPLDPSRDLATRPSGPAQSSKGCCKIDTRGKPFNFLVALVICANAVFIGLEADLGLLGTAPPGWKGLHGDMDGLGIDHAEAQELKDGIIKGLQADTGLKQDIQGELNKDLKGKMKLLDVKEELSLKTGPEDLKMGAYTMCEFFFAVFFTLELLIRLYDECAPRFCKDCWNFFDLLLVMAGLADVVLPFVFDTSMTWLSVLRTTRVLRVLRLFRVCGEFRVMGWSFAKSFATVLRVSLLALVVNFMLASMLTSTIGQHANTWGEQSALVHQWFGSIGRSLRTLFSIMTLCGWEEIAMVLSTIIPGSLVVTFIVAYILLNFFGVVSLASSLMGQTLTLRQQQEMQRQETRLEDRRANFANVLMTVLDKCNKSAKGLLSREDFGNALERNPEILMRLKELKRGSSTEDLLRLHDHLGRDTGCVDSPLVKIDSLVESMVHTGAQAASSSEVFETKYALAAMRREVRRELETIKQEAAQRAEEPRTNQQVADLESKVTTMVESVSRMQEQMMSCWKDVQTVSLRMETTLQHIQSDKGDVVAASAATQQKFDALSCQVAESRGAITALGAKLDSWATQTATTGALTDKLDYLSTQFTSNFAAQFAAQFSTLKMGEATPRALKVMEASSPSQQLLASPCPITQAKEQPKAPEEQPKAPESTAFQEQDRSTAAHGNFANFAFATWPDLEVSQASEQTSALKMANGLSPSASAEPESTVQAAAQHTVGVEPETVPGVTPEATPKMLDLEDKP